MKFHSHLTMQIKIRMTIINPSLHSNAKQTLTLPKQNRQQLLPSFSSTCIHPTTLRKQGLKKICET